jgi:NAD(P)-dependent dehydrogenase (short-subunit alcohol dehydrogenase family)
MSSSSFKIGPDTSTSSLSLHTLFGIKGRRALITGGGSGLGAFTAIAYALQGAHVYIIGRRKEKLDEVIQDFESRRSELTKNNSNTIEIEVAKEGKIIAIQGDISSREGIEKVRDTYGKYETHLDVLFNGAGIYRDTENKPKDDTNAMVKAQWEQEWSNFTDSFNVNVTSIYFFTLAMVPFLDKAKKPSFTDPGASVIIVASIAGLYYSRVQSVSYQTSKDAAIKLNALLAGRLQPIFIRSNVICPGIFPSEMTNAITPKDYENPQHPMHDAIHNVNPIKRSGTFEDWAGLVITLASRAGAYYNGATFTLDGGRVLNLSAA